MSAPRRRTAGKRLEEKRGEEERREGKSRQDERIEEPRATCHLCPLDSFWRGFYESSG
jgi:hypothetical protein